MSAASSSAGSKAGPRQAPCAEDARNDAAPPSDGAWDMRPLPGVELDVATPPSAEPPDGGGT